MATNPFESGGMSREELDRLPPPRLRGEWDWAATSSRLNAIAKRLQRPNLATEIIAFSRRWKVAELALFGSQSRGNAAAASDVDLLITFMPEAEWSSFDWIDMQDQLGAIFGRPVDLVSKRAIKNPFRRKRMLADEQVIYAA